MGYRRGLDEEESKQPQKHDGFRFPWMETLSGGLAGFVAGSAVMNNFWNEWAKKLPELNQRLGLDIKDFDGFQAEYDKVQHFLLTTVKQIPSEEEQNIRSQAIKQFNTLKEYLPDPVQERVMLRVGTALAVGVVVGATVWRIKKWHEEVQKPDAHVTHAQHVQTGIEHTQEAQDQSPARR